MTRTQQIASAIHIIALDRPVGRTTIYVDDEPFVIRIQESRITSDDHNERHVWDHVFIDYNWCGNRHGGVHYLMVALGEAEPNDRFVDRHAIARCEAIAEKRLAVAS